MAQRESEKTRRQYKNLIVSSKRHSIQVHETLQDIFDMQVREKKPFTTSYAYISES